MKLLNIFKKVTSKNSVTERTKVQKLEKNQLSKVIGGDGDTPLPSEGPINTTRSNIKTPTSSK